MTKTFSEQDRAIFKYFNGEREVYGDPLALWRQFTAACDGHPQQWLEWAEDDKQPLRQTEYAGKVVAAVRTVFGMLPYDPVTNKGAQEQHVEAALRGLFAFFDQKKTSSGNEPTSTPSTAA